VGLLAAAWLATVMIVGCAEHPTGSAGHAGARATTASPALATSRAIAAGPAPSAGLGAPASLSAGPFALDWDPTTGKGTVSQRYRNGDQARVCLQCKYPGYTGGLVIGNYNGSGFEYVPSRPLRGFRSLNIFCAQDESIWDRATSREYSFGWSENFGTGKDGERLAYLSGEIERLAPEQLVLRSRNRGGCYEVDKRLVWSSEARYLLVATHVRNVCARPIELDFWTGDDPWIGKYRSSEGDIGYADRALLRFETKIDPGKFRFGGVYDLGNSASGEKEGGFSGAANFTMLRPGLRLPDRIYLANRFAHEDREIDPRKPIDNRSLLALNFGWLALTLAPDETVSFGYALGLADTTGKAEPPTAPVISAAEWSDLDDERGPLGRVRFDREHVELRLTPAQLDVTGSYVLANDGARTARLGIRYPFPIDATHPKPTLLALDGRPITSFEATAAFWSVEIGARATSRFEVHYQQPLRERSATYIVTSANRWREPIRRAEFVIHYPASFRKVVVSYPADSVSTVGGEVQYRFLRAPFRPDVDVTVRWE
jgi:hypothetical protein